MGEPEIIEIIHKGCVTIENVNLKIVKHPNGWCDGCFYNDNKLVHDCPTLARQICCTRGNILIKDKDGK